MNTLYGTWAAQTGTTATLKVSKFPNLVSTYLIQIAEGNKISTTSAVAIVRMLGSETDDFVVNIKIGPNSFTPVTVLTNAEVMAPILWEAARGRAVSEFNARPEVAAYFEARGEYWSKVGTEEQVPMPDDTQVIEQAILALATDPVYMSEAWCRDFYSVAPTGAVTSATSWELQ